ncbi:hypothetical protein [Psychrilyobacter atlanticus]|uniref:hypothetical protein n=1 Tax=Psychrilyobacter atlanticus TaxID=271091 RepID=UPI000423A3A3|nr:hypothetical protein [Psychrilyobacter atlanticus]
MKDNKDTVSIPGLEGYIPRKKLSDHFIKPSDKGSQVIKGYSPKEITITTTPDKKPKIKPKITIFPKE